MSIPPHSRNVMRVLATTAGLHHDPKLIVPRGSPGRRRRADTWGEEDARASYERGAIYSGQKPHAQWCDDLTSALNTVEACYRGDRCADAEGNGDDFRLVRHLGDAIRELLDGGFVLPIQMACVAVNEVMIFAPDAAEDASVAAYELVIAHRSARELHLPINIVLVDAAGGAARVRIPRDGDYQIIH